MYKHVSNVANKNVGASLTFEFQFDTKHNFNFVRKVKILIVHWLAFHTAGKSSVDFVFNDVVLKSMLVNKGNNDVMSPHSRWRAEVPVARQ